jgi:nicotinate-nucleotide pyrophosphorylase (carboxylating)
MRGLQLPEAARNAVRAALAEDLGESGDLTTDAVIAPDCRAQGHFVARQALVVCGLSVAREVYRQLDDDLQFTVSTPDGESVEPGVRLASVRGRARPILRGERTAVNFVMRMCGIATATRDAVREIGGTAATILDTRKTAPGLRALDKMAVATGGAENHRMGLYDAVMIKDTHLAMGGTIADGVRRALDAGVARHRITVEVRNSAELQQAIAAGAGRALLDNMDLDSLREAVGTGRGRIVLEASGGLRPGRLREVAETGVDHLSVGWLTHSAPAADVAMEMELED